MLLGNYSGYMAYTTDLPFCIAYPLEFMDRKDKSAMMFRSLENHPVTFMGNEMVVCQLLTWDCSECKYERDQ